MPDESTHAPDTTPAAVCLAVRRKTRRSPSHMSQRAVSSFLIGHTVAPPATPHRSPQETDLRAGRRRPAAGSPSCTTGTRPSCQRTPCMRRCARKAQRPRYALHEGATRRRMSGQSRKCTRAHASGSWGAGREGWRVPLQRHTAQSVRFCRSASSAAARATRRSPSATSPARAMPCHTRAR